MLTQAKKFTYPALDVPKSTFNSIIINLYRLHRPGLKLDYIHS